MKHAPKAVGIAAFLILLAWLTYAVKREGPREAGGVGQLGPMAVGQAAPDFVLEDLKGEQVSLAEHRGQVVVLDFWATWCPPCRMVMPVLDAVYDRYRESGLVVLSLNQRETKQQIGRALKGRAHGSRILLDREGEVGRAYGVTAIPVLVLVDAGGNIAWINVGYTPDLEQQITEQLKELDVVRVEGPRDARDMD